MKWISTRNSKIHRVPPTIQQWKKNENGRNHRGGSGSVTGVRDLLAQIVEQGKSARKSSEKEGGIYCGQIKIQNETATQYVYINFGPRTNFNWDSKLWDALVSARVHPSYDRDTEERYFEVKCKPGHFTKFSRDEVKRFRIKDIFQITYNSPKDDLLVVLSKRRPKVDILYSDGGLSDA